MMKRSLLVVGLLALCALPTFAQDATAVATQDPSMMATSEVLPGATMEMMATAEPMMTMEPMATAEMMGTAEAMSTMEASVWPETIDINKEGLFPEGVEFDPVNNRFLVSSVSEGMVYAVDENGGLYPFVEDERIPPQSTLGLEVDEAGNRLFVAITDQATTAFLGVYDLTTAESIAFVDLTVATPNDPEHFANDIAVDSQGNAYVTDSYAGVIYRVDTAYNVTVWLEDESFSTQFALNGLDYQPEGDYILAVLVPELIKIPVSNPAAFNKVTMDTPISGGDGVLILNPRTVAVVSNDTGTVYKVETNDDFATAFISDRFETGPVNPTTLALANNVLYVVYAKLNEQEAPPSSFPIQRVVFPSDEMVGTAEPMATMDAMSTAEPMATMEMMSTAEAMPAGTMEPMGTAEPTTAP